MTRVHQNYCEKLLKEKYAPDTIYIFKFKKKSIIGKNGKNGRNGKDELPVRCTLYDIIFIKVTLHSDHF